MNGWQYALKEYYEDFGVPSPKNNFWFGGMELFVSKNVVIMFEFLYVTGEYAGIYTDFENSYGLPEYFKSYQIYFATFTEFLDMTLEFLAKDWTKNEKELFAFLKKVKTN